MYEDELLPEEVAFLVLVLLDDAAEGLALLRVFAEVGCSPPDSLKDERQGLIKGFTAGIVCTES